MSFLASLRSLFGLGLVAMSCVHAVRVSGAQRADAQGDGEHMRMTALRPIQPGDRERADAIAARARKFMDQYTDYRSAIASGYEIIFPGVRQKIYHFMRRDALRGYGLFQPRQTHGTALCQARIPRTSLQVGGCNVWRTLRGLRGRTQPTHSPLRCAVAPTHQFLRAAGGDKD